MRAPMVVALVFIGFGAGIALMLLLGIAHAAGRKRPISEPTVAPVPAWPDEDHEPSIAPLTGDEKRWEREFAGPFDQETD